MKKIEIILLSLFFNNTFGFLRDYTPADIAVSNSDYIFDITKLNNFILDKSYIFSSKIYSEPASYIQCINMVTGFIKDKSDSFCVMMNLLDSKTGTIKSYTWTFPYEDIKSFFTENGVFESEKTLIKFLQATLKNNPQIDSKSINFDFFKYYKPEKNLKVSECPWLFKLSERSVIKVIPGFIKDCFIHSPLIMSSAALCGGLIGYSFSKKNGKSSGKAVTTVFSLTGATVGVLIASQYVKTKLY